ncbi:MAG: tetrahydrofolate synthase [Treponema sp.]|jgi:dihydrofolate synthase/folylpolyglutamate synthase|nr:tetrahydrofolate synthase [Treponema sp.]
MSAINSPADLADWLGRFENNERLAFYKPFTLDKMRLIADLAGNPEGCAPVIHIAGSKGKGSVTTMIAAILEAGGIRTARYTSPQVTHYWDRICQGDAPFRDEVYVEAGRELVRVDERRLREYPGGEAPSLFEMFTLLFFLCARLDRVDAMVVETGLGGLHDATNVVIPAVSVLTLIELEHTELLGTTIGAIAAQKAGIIKAGRPVWAGEQPEEALALFRETAAAKNSSFFYLPERAALRDLRVSREGTAFTAAFQNMPGSPPDFAGFPEPLELSIPVAGAIQARNAVLAAAAAKTAFPLLEPGAVRRGLASLSLPARFERLLDDPALIIDGAHTPRSIEAVAQTFTALYGEGGVLIFGCVASKPAVDLARILIPHFSRIIVTTPGAYKESRPEDVYAAFRSLRGNAGNPEITLIPGTVQALETGIEKARAARLPALGTGSFYLAAELRRAAQRT